MEVGISESLPGERRRVEFSLTAEHLGFYNRDMKFVVEPGAFKVWVGADSASGLGFKSLRLRMNTTASPLFVKPG